MSSQRERIAAFLQLAKEELDVASWLVERAPRQCAYLVQQAAEKLARAILTDADVKFGTGHNLGQMAEVLPEGHPWIEKIKSLNRHSPAATRYRYPTMAGRLVDPPTTKTLKRDVAELADLLEEARRFLVASGRVGEDRDRDPLVSRLGKANARRVGSGPAR